jgi:hypothetical protein
MKQIEPRSEPTLSSALEHVLETTQKALVTRIELLQVEAQEDLSRAMQGAGVIAAGAALLFGGWYMLMGLTLLWLETYIGLAKSLCVLMSVNLVLGTFVIRSGIRILARMRLMAPDLPSTSAASGPTGGV